MDVVVVFGAVVGFAALALLVKHRTTTRPARQLPVLLNHERSHAEQLNVAGDGVALHQQLPTLAVDDYVPYATALGLYAEAFSAVQPALQELGTTAYLEALLRVNAAEPLSELGRSDEAIALLDFTSEYPLVEGGRRCSLAWILAMLGRSDEARATLENVDAVNLYDYQCEYWLTLAFVQRTLKSFTDCEVSLHNAAQTVERASSQRNLEFQWAELHRARGDVDGALSHYEAGARHRWRWQGGSGLLNWGTLLSDLGRHDDARAAWAQCIEQDPQSLAAIEARKLISSSSGPALEPVTAPAASAGAAP